MKVIIDHREPEKFRGLFSDEDVVSVEQLKCGDFLINDQWVFERKTIRDLCISLADGRLFKQALRLVQSAHHPVIILEGCSNEIREFGMRREAVQGALITLSVFFGLPVLRSLEPEETVRLMRYTAEQGVRFAEGGVQRAGYRPKGRKARQLYVLQSLPGIGKKRAETLLEHFGGIEAVMSADEDKLTEVDGIGAPIAEKIRNIVQETGVSYNVYKD
ncbi:MAG TPA: ERCC4 domain-containing protein [Tichowtungia sp.]|nr:ERCC4 domain-containing protein [Tichowtungia sp.]